MGAAGQVTFRQAANRYCADIVPTKASRTQDENQIEFEFLCEIFDKHPVALEMIKPVHVTRSVYPLAHGESGELAQEVGRIKAKKARYRAENKAVSLYWS